MEYQLADQNGNGDDQQAQAKRQRMRSIAIAVVLGLLVVLFYVATLVRMGGDVMTLPL